MMEKGINSSVKKAFYGLDWTICFLWAIVVVVAGWLVPVLPCQSSGIDGTVSHRVLFRPLQG